MGLFDRIRRALSNQDICPPEHLEGYKRIGEDVYEAKVELANETNTRVKLLIRVAESFQIMGDALLIDIGSNHVFTNSSNPEITHKQAEIWYGQIPDLLIAARKEAIQPGCSNLTLPIFMGRRIETAHTCPVSHLAGLRRAASTLEDLIAEDISLMRYDKEHNRETLLLYEEARTRRNTGDALVGSIMNGKNVPHQIHEDAIAQYWQALFHYLLVVQGIEDRALLKAWWSPHSKLESENSWKVTASLAKEDIQQSGELERAQRELETFWEDHPIAAEERQYEHSVEQLLHARAIQENGYWYRVPYQPVYMVVAPEVEIHHTIVRQNHEFVWDYENHGHRDGFLTRPAFRYTTERSH